MEKDWKKIFATTDSFQMELIRHLLEEHEIPAVVINKQDSSYRFGLIFLYTHESDEDEALALIKSINEQTD